MGTQTLERDLSVDEASAWVGGPTHATHPPLPSATRRTFARLRGLVPSLRRNTVIELTVFAALAVAYNVVRGTGGTDAATALGHGRDLVAAEGPVFEHLELSLNHWLVGITPLAVAACYIYALLHYVATPTVFFMSRRRGGWPYWRGYWALVVASGIALAVYAAYPAAPPRLTPGLGVVDLMSHFSEFGWWGSAASAPRGIGDATNQYAAMPSMHCGWALWCGIQLWGMKKARWRVVAVAYPAVLFVVVMATGNHFLLDVVAGVGVVVAAYGIVELVGRALGKTGSRSDQESRSGADNGTPSIEADGRQTAEPQSLGRNPAHAREECHERV